MPAPCCLQKMHCRSAARRLPCHVLLLPLRPAFALTCLRTLPPLSFYLIFSQAHGPHSPLMPAFLPQHTNHSAPPPPRLYCRLSAQLCFPVSSCRPFELPCLSWAGSCLAPLGALFTIAGRQALAPIARAQPCSPHPFPPKTSGRLSEVGLPPSCPSFPRSLASFCPVFCLALASRPDVSSLPSAST
jgi:hypothetical protein